MAETPSPQSFEPIRKDIAKLLHQPEYDDGSAGPVLVRLAWSVICPILYHRQANYVHIGILLEHMMKTQILVAQMGQA